MRGFAQAFHTAEERAATPLSLLEAPSRSSSTPKAPPSRGSHGALLDESVVAELYETDVLAAARLDFSSVPQPQHFFLLYLSPRNATASSCMVLTHGFGLGRESAASFAILKSVFEQEEDIKRRETASRQSARAQARAEVRRSYVPPPSPALGERGRLCTLSSAVLSHFHT